MTLRFDDDAVQFDIKQWLFMVVNDVGRPQGPSRIQRRDKMFLHRGGALPGSDKDHEDEGNGRNLSWEACYKCYGHCASLLP